MTRHSYGRPPLPGQDLSILGDGSVEGGGVTGANTSAGADEPHYHAPLQQQQQQQQQRPPPPPSTPLPAFDHPGANVFQPLGPLSHSQFLAPEHGVPPHFLGPAQHEDLLQSQDPHDGDPTPLFPHHRHNLTLYHLSTASDSLPAEGPSSWEHASLPSSMGLAGAIGHAPLYNAPDAAPLAEIFQHPPQHFVPSSLPPSDAHVATYWSDPRPELRVGQHSQRADGHQGYGLSSTLSMPPVVFEADSAASSALHGPNHPLEMHSRASGESHLTYSSLTSPQGVEGLAQFQPQGNPVFSHDPLPPPHSVQTMHSPYASGPGPATAAHRRMRGGHPVSLDQVLHADPTAAAHPVLPSEPMAAAAGSAFGAGRSEQARADASRGQVPFRRISNAQQPWKLVYLDPTGKPVSCRTVLDAHSEKNLSHQGGHLTCYRRNYLFPQTHYHFADPGAYGGQIYAMRNDGSQQCVPVHALSVLLSSYARPDGDNVELWQYTTKRDKGSKFTPDRHDLRPRPPPGAADLPSHLHGPILPMQEGDDHGAMLSSHAHTFERVQFIKATQNNGKRRPKQQYFVLRVTLFALIGPNRDTDWVQVASCESDDIVVRGRSPGHYDQEQQGPRRRTARAMQSIRTDGLGRINETYDLHGQTASHHQQESLHQNEPHQLNDPHQHNHPPHHHEPYQQNDNHQWHRQRQQNEHFQWLEQPPANDHQRDNEHYQRNEQPRPHEYAQNQQHFPGALEAEHDISRNPLRAYMHSNYGPGPSNFSPQYSTISGANNIPTVPHFYHPYHDTLGHDHGSNFSLMGSASPSDISSQKHYSSDSHSGSSAARIPSQLPSPLPSPRGQTQRGFASASESRSDFYDHDHDSDEDPNQLYPTPSEDSSRPSALARHDSWDQNLPLSINDSFNHAHAVGD